MKKKEYAAFFAGALFAAPLFVFATVAFGQANAGTTSATAAGTEAVSVTMTDQRRDALIRSLLVRVQKLERRVARLENMLKARTDFTPVPRPFPFKERDDLKKFKKRVFGHGSGNIRVCHAEGGADMTLRVNIAAMKTHLGHGDTLGACGSDKFSGILKKLLEKQMKKMEKEDFDHMDDEEDKDHKDEKSDDDEDDDTDHQNDDADGGTDDSTGTSTSSGS